MQLAPDAIEEFKEIYQKEFDITLSDAEALELATSFFNLMKAVYRPIPEEACTCESGTLSSSC